MSDIKLVFLDIETTGLDPFRHEILEVAMIKRTTPYSDSDKTIHFSLPIIEEAADAKALEINRYEERREELDALQVSIGMAENWFRSTLTDAVVVGNNPQFDLRFIEQWLAMWTLRWEDAERDNGATPWHYHPVDLKALVAGAFKDRLGPPPWSTKKIAERTGVQIPEGYHSALVDASWNRDVYDSLYQPTDTYFKED